MVKLYTGDKRAKCEEIFIPFKILCKRKNVRSSSNKKFLLLCVLVC